MILEQALHGLSEERVGILETMIEAAEAASARGDAGHAAAAAGLVLLGEHLGQLFTIAWTVILSICFIRLKLFPKWVAVFGIISAVIYLLAQADLFATVMPGFPVWDLAGFIGSTLWLIWLIIVGVRFIKLKKAIV